MESHFRQPKQVINVEVNKQSIARNFGIGDNEVCYAKAGQPLTTRPALTKARSAYWSISQL